MDKKILILLVFGSLIAIGFLAVFVMTPRGLLGPLLTNISQNGANIGVIAGNNKDKPVSVDIQHCSLNSDAIVDQERLAGSSFVKQEDDNIRLTLLVDKANVTEYEYQNFSVEVYNKAQRPLIFPEVNGDQYTITGYNQTGQPIFTLGGEYGNYGGIYDGNFITPPKKPSCFINKGESATFDASTRIGTRDHNTQNVAYAIASVKYVVNGQTSLLQTAYNGTGNNISSGIIDAKSDQNNNLLKIIVNPVSLPKMKSYFDAGLALPYPPKIGKEEPMWVIARTMYYEGPYTIQVYLPDGLQLVSGKTQVENHVYPSGNIYVEQEATTIRIRPIDPGNYAISAIIYSNFNGTRVGNVDTIWLSVNENGTSFVSRSALPNSILPSGVDRTNNISQIIQDENPIPMIKLKTTPITGKPVYYSPTASYFSWPDRLKWYEENVGAIFVSQATGYTPAIAGIDNRNSDNNTDTISVKNDSHLALSVENTALQPSILAVDFYNIGDILAKNENISKFYSSCTFYSPTSQFRTSNDFQQCPIEDARIVTNDTIDFIFDRHPKQNQKQNFAYDFDISTKKPGLYIMNVYAQWANKNEINFNDSYRAVNSQFLLQIED